MNLTNLARITLVTFIIACATTFQAKAVMTSYVVSLIGDTCFTAGIAAMGVNQKLTLDNQVELLKRGKCSQTNQLKRDAEKIAPYAPLLMTVGAVLSIGSRISMLSQGGKGIALALFSMPINWALIAGGYYARLEQAPDATFLDKGVDKGINLYNKLTDGGKNK